MGTDLKGHRRNGSSIDRLPETRARSPDLCNLHAMGGLWFESLTRVCIAIVTPNLYAGGRLLPCL